MGSKALVSLELCVCYSAGNEKIQRDSATVLSSGHFCSGEHIPKVVAVCDA